MEKLFISGLIVLLPFVNVTAHASMLTFDQSNSSSVFSGNAGTGSLTGNFADVSGGVQLVITSNLGSGENLDPSNALYLNINPAKDGILGNLVFTLKGNTGGFTSSATVNTSADGYKADGDGSYDIDFTYHSGTTPFTNGQSQTYLITTTSGSISASDFTNYCSSGGNKGSWLAAVHVLNTISNGNGSAWVGATATPTPIPAATWLLGSGLMGLAGLRRKSKA